MKERGVTLIEMLAVIGVITILFVLVAPSIINFLNNRHDAVEQTTTALVNSAVQMYIEQDPQQYPRNKGDRYCFVLEDLIAEGFVEEGVIENSEKYSSQNIMQVRVSANNFMDITIDHTCQRFIAEEFYQDETNAAMPVLLDNLVPIVGSPEGFVTADLKEQWYDYDNSQWANAVLIKDEAYEDYQAEAGKTIDNDDVLGYFVWIPRYRYQLFNVAGEEKAPEVINVRFEQVRSARARGAENDDWLTHPAFSFGDKELSGYWLGKFTTTGSASEPTVLPDETMLQHNNLSENYQASENFAANISILNSRLARNLEWGAAALLSHSDYGNENQVWNNPNENFLTGCVGASADSESTSTCHAYDTTEGVKASTTGNIYGVYDMSGGAFESVMSGMLDLGEEVLLRGDADFDNLNSIPERYIDAYEFGITSDDADAYQRRILGDATAETRNWDDSNQSFITDEQPFFVRGGNIDGGGIFSFDKTAGNITSGFRLVLSEERKNE